MEQPGGSDWPDAGAGPVWEGFHALGVSDRSGWTVGDGVAGDQQNGDGALEPGCFCVRSVARSHARAVLVVSALPGALQLEAAGLVKKPFVYVYV